MSETPLQGDVDFTPQAWELAQQALLLRGAGGVMAHLRRDRATLLGAGPTSTAALRDLARKIDSAGWVGL